MTKKDSEDVKIPYGTKTLGPTLSYAVNYSNSNRQHTNRHHYLNVSGNIQPVKDGKSSLRYDLGEQRVTLYPITFCETVNLKSL